jgi:nucleotide-binding universal stress UspA family protein
VKYKDILVFLGSDKSNAQRVNFAITLASKHNAHLVGVAYNVDVPRHVAMLIPGLTVEKQREASKIVAQNLIDEFMRLTEQASLSSEGTILKCKGAKAPVKLAAFARNFDLSIMHQVDEKGDQSDLDKLITEEVLFSSGRPVLYVPYVGVRAVESQKALIAWDGSRAATRAVHDALPLLETLDDVVILTVGNNPAESDKKLRRAQVMQDHLKRHGVIAKLEFALCENGDIGSTILNSLVDTGSSLLVMGGYGSSRVREYVFGGVTRTILESMTTPVCMSN